MRERRPIQSMTWLSGGLSPSHSLALLPQMQNLDPSCVRAPQDTVFSLGCFSTASLFMEGTGMLCPVCGLPVCPSPSYQGSGGLGARALAPIPSSSLEEFVPAFVRTLPVTPISLLDRWHPSMFNITGLKIPT